MPSFPLRRAGLAACAVLPLALAGCTSTQSSSAPDTGFSLKNLIPFGDAPAASGQTVPAAMEVADCPPVTVSEGGAAIRAGSAESAAVRSQISIANVARECLSREDGVVVVKVGVQVRALLGPGGSGGRYDTPVNIVLKSGDKVLVSRSRRAGITIPAGQYEQSAVIVEEGMAVPRGTTDFDIEVSLGGAGRAAAPRSRRKRT